MMENELIQDGCRDEPSILDYSFSEFMFGDITLPEEEIKFVPVTIFNQGAEVITNMACTRYGLAHIVNAQNERLASITDYDAIEISPKQYWVEYLTVNPGAQYEGATLQSALDQFKKAGQITSYSVANSIDEMKASLNKCRLIYTGSNTGDWSLIDRKYRLRTDGRLVGHAFCIVGYTKDDEWVAINSYGPNDGVFFIPFSLTNTLFTRYSVSDRNDEEYVLNYKKRIMEGIKIEDAKKAYELNIWNGERPDEPITRQEAAAMVYRATNIN